MGCASRQSDEFDDDFFVDDFFVDAVEPVLVDSFDEPESFDDDPDDDPDSFAEDDPLSELADELEESDDPGGVVALDPRLSVLKKPDPLKVTPTGWNTFLTGRTFPDVGWVYSVSVASVNACWTSMVSPVLTNL